MIAVRLKLPPKGARYRRHFRQCVHETLINLATHSGGLSITAVSREEVLAQVSSAVARRLPLATVFTQRELERALWWLRFTRAVTYGYVRLVGSGGHGGSANHVGGYKITVLNKGSLV